MDKVGLDAALFMRFTRMCRNMFLVLSVIGCGILIPVYLVSGGGKGGFLQGLTPLNTHGSAYWALVVCAYLFDIVICFFLWYNYRAVVRLRRAYFDSPEYQRSLHARTLLLTDIPKALRTDKGIVKLTEEVKATNDVPRAAIARNVKDLPELVEEHEEAVRSLEGYLAKYLRDPNKLPPKRPTCRVSKNDKAYTKGQKVDAIEYLTSRIKELELEIKEVRETVDKRNAMSYGFASYESISEAHSVAYVARNKTPQGAIIKLAPKPNDLIWKNLKITKKDRRWKNFINNLWVAVLTVIWIAPNVLIAVFLSNLSNLANVWPAFRTTYDAHNTWWAIVQGVLSPAITSLVYFFLPAVFRRLCMRAGDTTKTSRDRHVMHKLYSFFVLNNLFVFSLFAALWAFIASVVKSSKSESTWDAIKSANAAQQIFQSLTTLSPFWITWLLQRNLGAAVDLAQLVNLAWGSFSRRFLSPTPRQLIEQSAPQPFDYAGYYNYFLFYATVAMCFATLQPLVLPVTAVYFSLDSYLKKYLILYIFITKTESGGSFWRALYNRFIFLALLGNVIAALAIAAQYDFSWAMLASMAPLPFLMLAFKWYCARAFDDQTHYYTKGKAMRDSEYLAGSDGKSKRSDRVGVRFGHPVLYKPLVTPMVHAKSQHLLKSIYSGRTSLDDNASTTGYSDVYMDAMDRNKPGKTSGPNAPFEIVHEGQLDFQHYKNRPEFRDESGGDGELYGRAQDIVRTGTPGSFMAGDAISRTNTMESRSRSASRDSEQTRVADGHGVEYPKGYHQTPSALREHSPARSVDSVDVGSGRWGRRDESQTREGLVSSAARMGRSPPPPAQYNPSLPSEYGPARTPGSTPGEEETSYDYFRRGRQI